MRSNNKNSHVIPGPGMAPYVVFLYTEQYMGVRRYGTTHVNKYCIFSYVL